ncbi:MAG: DNA repair protein RecN [Oscillospiraceae bacterium]|nr:DNA repair protein RecN [Oscillospiraceae bacterium]
MLKELTIENVAVIERADLCFGRGLNVLTGETGAGKSIIIDAIGAVTGSRVSRELIRRGAERASVTAVFAQDEDIQTADEACLAACRDWLLENGLDFDDEELIIQRRVTADGKSSCRVNGNPITAGQLRSLGGLLLEIHGQNDGLQLLDEKRHLNALDRYAALDSTAYRDCYAGLRALWKEKERHSLDEIEKARMQDLLTDTIRELEAAQLQPGEQEELSARRELLRNSEKLTEALQTALRDLSAEPQQGNEGAVSLVQDAAWNCQRASGYAAELSDCTEKLNQAGLLLADVEESLQDFMAALSFSPEEYDRLEHRLHELSRLERKYRRPADELPEYLDECRKRLNEISLSEESLRRLEQEIQKQEKQCRKLAADLHRQREKAAIVFSEQVEEELHELSMPAARFTVDILDQEELGAEGLDSARFLLAANRGEAPGRLSKIASGGELSRVMLALKNVLSRGDPVPCMIFDEIDTGVSGIAAQRVGEKLSGLSRTRQVLCVTHLPQIAAMADCHFVIEKREEDGRTRTDVHRLDRSGQRQEIARLYGGDNITETTLLSAEEQLKYAEKFKNRGV